MRTKPSDIRYCGVDEKKIKNARPELNWENVRYLYHFVVKRYKIHLKKDVEHRPKPWTKDQVLKNYRFTNVRREHDKETKWVIDNIVNANISYDDKIMNIILFRLFNKHETAELLDIPIEFSKHPNWNPEHYRKSFECYQKICPRYKFFTAAFNTGGLKAACARYVPNSFSKSCIPIRILWFIHHLFYDVDIVYKIDSQKTQDGVYNELKRHSGIGDFLAYQMFVDFTYIPEFMFSENEFTVAGPGCKRGLDYIFEDKDGMSYEECLFWLRDNQDELFNQVSNGEWNPTELFSDIPKRDRYLNVMSLENCHCELSKYIKAITGTGRPRNNYPGGDCR